MNRSKAPLALMGQLLMVLFFALTAAICLQAFAKSETISQKSAERDAASLLAQNAAETLKSVHGKTDIACGVLGGTVDNGVWTFRGDANGRVVEDGAYHVLAERIESIESGLGRACVRVFNGEENEIISLICSWQEVVE